MVLRGQICPTCGRRLPETKEEKLRRLADRSGGPAACWPWMGRLDHAGYGMIDVYERGRPRIYRAHRLAYEQAHRPIPAGAILLHACDNPRCCNPAHLTAGSHADNIADMWAKGRQQRYDRQARGDGHHSARLTADTVAEMRRRFLAGETALALGPEYGISQAAAWAAIHGVTWAHVPGAVTPQGRGRGSRGRATIGARTRGAENQAASLTEDDVREIRRLAAEGVRQRDLAEHFGVDQSQISKIVARRRWAHLD